jgi:hypothetical protein
LDKTKGSDAGASVTVTVPRRAGLIFQVQKLPGTDVWAVIEKGELEELVEKARRWDRRYEGDGAGRTKRWREI